jgi:hypothetical protein
MPDFHPSATELTSAATDVALAIVAFVGAGLVLRSGSSRWRAHVWAGVLLALGAGAALGAVAHGFAWDAATRDAIWIAIYASLGILVALFVVAAVGDSRGEARGRRLVAPMLVASAGFVAVAIAIDRFAVFVVYQLLAVGSAIVLYAQAARTAEVPGAGWITAGLAWTLVAGGVQASGRAAFTLVVPFDHNGAYHLIQILALVLLLRGLTARSG